MLLAVLFCTTAMCFTDVLASPINLSGTTDAGNNAAQNSVQEIKSTVVNSENGTYSDEEVYLAAQLVWHEAHNQSYNGKVAIAEVLLNRVKSGLFPNSISEVINQKGQFANSRRIKNVNPTEQEIRIAYNVLNGSLRVLNDADVLYFRNPKVSTGVSADVDKDWGTLDYATFIGDHAFYSQEVKQVAKDDTNVANNSDASEVKSSIFDRVTTSLKLNNVVNKVKEIASAKHNKDAEQKPEEESKKAELDNNIVVLQNEETSQEILDNSVVTLDQVEQNGSDVQAALALQLLTAAQANDEMTDNVTVDNVLNGLDVADDEESLEEEASSEENTSSEEDSSSEDDAESDSDEAVASEEEVQIQLMYAAIAASQADAGKLEDEEVIDEDDPVARAQRQARIDEKNRIKQMEKLEAENAKANEAATAFAKQNEKDAVERVNTLLKLGQTQVKE